MNKESRAAAFFVNLAAVLLGAVLFAGSFPNPLVEGGLSILAWIAYVPVFWVIRRVSLPASLFWGALYAYSSYSLFNYWLGLFHPLAGLIVNSVYLVYMVILFPLLKLALMLFPRRGYLLQWLLWLAYEYLRTLGFLGYPYGITGYSQWQALPFIQIADIFGVWGVSALVLFPSVFLAGALESFPRHTPGALPFFRREKIPAAAWAAALIFTLVYGFISPVDYSHAPKAKIALIQHNTDPWRGGPDAYRENSRVLMRLSREALDAEPDTDLVAWCETAFVPRIYWHLTYRDEPEFYPLVQDLMNFLGTQTVPYVIGNDDARKEVSPGGYWDTVDYNAAMFFHGETFIHLYRKLRLVPFTEHFPYRKQLPWVYDALVASDTHFWEPGEEAAVFEIPEKGWKFSTPICFEDTFGYLSRDFTRNGAEIIVNMSNDAWSGSLSAQMQHLSMAVFRAVENRRSLVRSTASGQTCAVDPNGKILAMAAPFEAVYLNTEVPVLNHTTLYTKLGDFTGFFFSAAAAAVLLIGAVLGILKVIKKGKDV
jgi:apolipoprotein N-acyltransferase